MVHLRLPNSQISPVVLTILYLEKGLLEGNLYFGADYIALLLPRLFTRHLEPNSHDYPHLLPQFTLRRYILESPIN